MIRICNVEGCYVFLYYFQNFCYTFIFPGETGSGKSTQVPQYLLEAGWAAGNRVIAVTQPRRVSAVTVVTRIAEEKGVSLGKEVGYTIRFEDCSDPNVTRVRFLTDGMIIREMMQDPLLSRYSVVMIDEAHERSLNCDIALGLLKKIAKKRPELRIIISSATIDAERFQNYFNVNEFADASKSTSVVLTVEGRTYPVDIFYTLDPVPNYITALVDTIVKIHKQENEGDVLAFLTGQEEVEQAVALLVEEARKLSNEKLKMNVMPMYASLPSSEQLKVFRRTPHNVRKIIIATNIAEASITINGIVFVVDSGFVKIKAYNPKSGIESLITVATSKASATQRSGRAGRVRSGKAYRLYPETEFEKLQESTIPEMQRTAMAPTLLQLKALGIDNIVRFPFLSPPPAENMIRGIELLYALGAVDSNCKLTVPLGLQLAEFPLDPMFAKSLLISEEFGCSEDILTIAAMTQIQNVFVSPSNQKIAAEKARRKFAVEEGDHLTMINVYDAFLKNKNSRWCHEHYLNYKGLCRAIEIREQLKRVLNKFKIKMMSAEGNAETVCRCLTAGLFANAALLHHSGVYKTVREGHELVIHPTSVLYTADPLPKCVIFNEVIQTTKDFMRDITVVQSEWLFQLAPHYYEFGSEREIAIKRARIDK